MIQPLPQDASFRRYFRLQRPSASAMLMDAPPEKESIEPFIRVAHHLQRLDLFAPTILGQNSQNGFALIDDLGDQTFSRLLKQGYDESSLYDHAIEVLISLHGNQNAVDIDVGHYDLDAFTNELCLFTQWYLPAITNQLANQALETDFLSRWKTVYEKLPELPQTLVLRDYHVDNLMMHNQRCAVLDFQDALTGSPAYDIVSLLEDARRDIDGSMVQPLLAKYLAAFPNLDQSAFEHHYAVWGVQRHFKVAGIFTRLWKRDNKPQYLQHLPRVMSLISRHLKDPVLQSVQQWFDQNNISLQIKDFKEQ